MVLVLHLSPIHGEFQSLCYSLEFVPAQGKGPGLSSMSFHPKSQADPIQNSKWVLEWVVAEYAGGWNHLKMVSWVPGRAKHFQGSPGCQFNHHHTHQMAQGSWATFSLQ